MQHANGKQMTLLMVIYMCCFFIVWQELVVFVRMSQTAVNGAPPLTDDEQFELDLRDALGENPSLNDLGKVYSIWRL